MILKPIHIFISSIFTIFIGILIYALILSLPIECEHLDYYITIPKNSTVSSVSKILEDNLCLNSLIFKIAMKITMNEKNIRYGRYDFKSTNNVRSLIDMITSIRSDRIKITIPEGYKMSNIATLFEEKIKIDVEEFISLCYNEDFISTLGIVNASSLEGYLFPDTYIFLKSYTEKDIIEIMVKQFLFNYNEYIDNSNTNLNRSEIVILASIIQGEAMYDDEMKTISSVYHNRLNKNMLLQADPTIQYILPETKKRILVKHTKIKNPYNTYLYNGLPPGPINNPGISAIIAAAYPIKTDYLYFVADNKGRHIFNKTFKAHLKSKN
tara:strand:- start:2894 stop:3865 length:972 start_codon:yes stop_codon:yes gene_type:complete